MGGYYSPEILLKLADKAQKDGKKIEWDLDLDDFFESEDVNNFIKHCDPFTIAWLCRHAIKTKIDIST